MRIHKTVLLVVAGVACIAMAADVVEHAASGEDARVWHGRTRARLGVRVRD